MDKAQTAAAQSFTSMLPEAHAPVASRGVWIGMLRLAPSRPLSGRITSYVLPLPSGQLARCQVPNVCMHKPQSKYACACACSWGTDRDGFEVIQVSSTTAGHAPPADKQQRQQHGDDEASPVAACSLAQPASPLLHLATRHRTPVPAFHAYNLPHSNNLAGS